MGPTPKRGALYDITHREVMAAAAAFADDPLGDLPFCTWKRLRIAMWAHQGAAQMPVDAQGEKLADLILSLAIAHRGSEDFDDE